LEQYLLEEEDEFRRGGYFGSPIFGEDSENDSVVSPVGYGA